VRYGPSARATPPASASAASAANLVLEERLGIGNPRAALGPRRRVARGPPLVGGAAELRHRSLSDDPQADRREPGERRADQRAPRLTGPRPAMATERRDHTEREGEPHRRDRV